MKGWFAVALCTSLMATAGTRADSPAPDLEQTSESRLVAEAVVSDGAWMAVPIPFSNPTLGSGLQAAVLYLYEKQNAETPNATSGLGGFISDTDSYFMGAFHDDYFADDRYRLTLFAGTGDMNFNYYGIGEAAQDDPDQYNIVAIGLFAKFLMRIPSTAHWYAGLRYLGSASTVAFDVADEAADLPGLEGDSNTSGLGLMVSYDSRDDNYYPHRGQSFAAFVSHDHPSLGSDYPFDRSELLYSHYQSLRPSQVLAMAVEAKNISGRAPFYMQPMLSMRGFDTTRYRDSATLSVMLEWRYTFSERWGMVAFAEAGAVSDAMASLASGQQVQSAGLGLRWQATEDKAINLSLDLTFSRDDSAVHIRAGEAF